MDEFDSAAEGRELKEILKEIHEAVDYGAMLALATAGVATCLICLLGNNKAHDSDIVESVPEEIYQEALQLISSTANPGDWGAEAQKIYGIQDFTPERAWPMALVPAIYSLCGLSSDGVIRELNRHILNQGDDFPLNLRYKQLEVAGMLEEDLTDFLKMGAERIRVSVNYPYEINPMWLFMATEIAQENGTFSMTDFNAWFMPSFEAALVEVHQAMAENTRAENINPAPQKQYN